jgi:hypothetical protein
MSKMSQKSVIFTTYPRTFFVYFLVFKRKSGNTKICKKKYIHCLSKFEKNQLKVEKTFFFKFLDKFSWGVKAIWVKWSRDVPN